MSCPIRRPRALFGAALSVGATLALVIGLGVLAGAGAAASSAAPKNTSPPKISGTPQEGQKLTGDKGTWSGSPTDYNYFWTRCDKAGGSCSNISGANGLTYTLTSADAGNTVRFKVEAENADGSAFASSEQTAVITAATKSPPKNTSLPTIKGTPQQGQKLTGDKGKWSGSPTDYNYFWTRCNKSGNSCSNISGANGASYTPSSADVGNTVRFKVEAKNADGSTFASSEQTAVITAATKSLPHNTSPPTIKGTPQQGQKLTGDKGKWSGSPTDYNYFWTRCDKAGGSCSNISGANGATYTLASADVGNTVRFKVEAENAAGSNFASSTATAVIVAATKPPPPPPAPAAGCPSGTGTVQVAAVGPPARLLIDQQQQSPSLINRRTRQLILRYHVSVCGGRSVQGALVYATALPFTQLTIPAEQATSSDGWVELRFRMRATFRVTLGPLVIFARARKPGENVLGGISSRRLFSVRVSSR